MSFVLRPIEPDDDRAVAQIIRTVMPTFGADGPGFAIHDAEVDAMSSAYAGPRSAYFVLISETGAVMGGGGIAPLAGGDPDTCELRKMYFLEHARGKGMGRALLARCIETARACRYARMYLETLTNMHAARALYERAGFRKLDRRLGETGHFGCNSYFLLDL